MEWAILAAGLVIIGNLNLYANGQDLLSLSSSGDGRDEAPGPSSQPIGYGFKSPCPGQCACNEALTAVDCSKRKLRQIPTPLPAQVEKL